MMSLAPRSMPATPQGSSADAAQEQFLERIAQSSYGRGKREPLHRYDVLHHVASGFDFGLHAPELYDLRTTTRAIRDRAEELAHTDAMAGLLDNLASRACQRAFVGLELAARQHPQFVLCALHDGNQRARTVAHHDASRCMNCLARHARPICQPSRLAKLR